MLSDHCDCDPRDKKIYICDDCDCEVHRLAIIWKPLVARISAIVVYRLLRKLRSYENQALYYTESQRRHAKIYVLN